MRRARGLTAAGPLGLNRTGSGGPVQFLMVMALKLNTKKARPRPGFSTES